jgi:mono/diheme cytochrome c family protein/glucose/arabinose dehydrogenase
MLLRATLCLLTLSFAAGPGRAQNGDRPGEAQPNLPAELEIPASPALSVHEALDGFALPPDFRIECAASEPLIEDPVCMAFDGDGRIWVAEMRAYMPDVEGRGETEPLGRIGVLTDTDGDGVFDSRKDFLEDLVLPRAVLPYRDGALVIVPPELRFYRDTDGDGAADSHLVIASGLGGIASPEHAINGLRWTFDNWIQCSNHRLRFRETEEGWVTQRTNGGGQWGLTLDEEGRAFFNTNSDPLRADAYSSHYAVRNTNFGTAGGVNFRVVDDMQVWPSHITPGVNRGYQPVTLRDDFTLRNFTGACGPLVYLGGAFPSEFRGNAFVAEPCGNLVKRYTLHDQGELGFEGRNAYQGREFLTSNDERFRPVNLYDGPDGALYVVDLYRGVLQHRLFVTSWLRRQIEARGLETPLGLGRIWRVVHEKMPERGQPKLRAASWSELVRALGHENGWWRLRAQQLIVEAGVGDADAIELCREALEREDDPLGRLHVLWTLAGIGGLDRESALRGLADEDPRVLRAAVRCAEVALSTGDEALLAAVLPHARSEDARLRHQVLLSLGEANTAAADRALADLLFEDAGSQGAREAILSGIGQRELSFLQDLFARPGWPGEKPGRKELVRDLARCVTREGRSESLSGLLRLIVDAAMTEELGFMPFMGWRSSALIEGWMAGRPKGPKGEPAPVALASEPEAIVSARWLAEFNPTEPLREMLKWITWPGGPNAEAFEPVRALTEAEQAQFVRGRAIYTDICAACHQSSGLGDEGLAPALRYSPWLLADELTPIRIVVGGLSGPIDVQGQVWDLEMPVYDSSPEEVAAVLTYARREWGHGAEPITAEQVRRVVAELAERGRVWTAQELAEAQERR